jgi:hypothetical protein
VPPRQADSAWWVAGLPRHGANVPQRTGRPYMGILTFESNLRAAHFLEECRTSDAQSVAFVFNRKKPGGKVASRRATLEFLQVRGAIRGSPADLQPLNGE